MDDRLESLRALLDAALDAVSRLQGDELLPRLLRVFAKMPPEDRDVILKVLEREVALRTIRKDADVEPLSGMRLGRPNPHARLYVRMVEGADFAPKPYMSREEVMHAIIRAARMIRAHYFATHDDEPSWVEPIVTALQRLDPGEREAVAWMNRGLLELLARAEREFAEAPQPAERRGSRS
jgi:transposase